MNEYIVVIVVNAPTLREARVALKEVYQNAYGPGELEAEIVSKLEESPESKERRAAVRKARKS